MRVEQLDMLENLEHLVIIFIYRRLLRDNIKTVLRKNNTKLKTYKFYYSVN